MARQPSRRAPALAEPGGDGANDRLDRLAGDRAEAAANLFAFLRAADRSDAPIIEAAPIPTAGLGEAINDRLQRAAGRIG